MFLLDDDYGDSDDNVDYSQYLTAGPLDGIMIMSLCFWACVSRI